MPCYHHQLASPIPGRTKNGKTPYKFLGKARNYWTRYQSVKGLILLPCRQCIGCRLERSRQWATRLLHEKKSHEKACFLTLTYDDNHVPKTGTLDPSRLTTFFRDLRARLDYYGKEKIKYFACGEYGDENHRPHYHALLYGPISGNSEYNRGDPEYVQERPARSGADQWSHSDIRAVWPDGDHTISELSFESAAYVARYVLKKVSGISAPDHYGALHPEFQRCSKGLGKAHFDTWQNDLYPSDHVVLPGRGSFLPPPYYDRLLEKVDPRLFAAVKAKRQEAQEELDKDGFIHLVADSYREEAFRTILTEETLKRGI